MINFEEKTAYTVEDLRRIVHLLRAPGGCPWDGAQTHESIRRNFLEEAYEVAEAIDEKNPAHLKEELGDVLLQVLFHASIEEDAGRFTLDDVADGICKKLIFRHPHIFGNVEVASSEEVLRNWDDLKRKEKHPIYGKFVNKTTKFVAECLDETCKEGDTVRIMETRPLSKTKRWRLVQIIERAK